ncbi:uncharacterized protein N7446_010694 [Penicillium canescens]|uniref:Uncharacterized protein n=1 Tax=Penicillium canescens TaxID=5083 RepID=A0AAD6N8F3_PENCN|nr:uncharacterized protein N7446_010694 [Penicillium canescens]KAJ6041416.1 hypothetical protein N7460_006806 [Penicillium canescens]KAJ6050585.1 hypothetical protein N7446_010694 [Penicillium canescens]KAJ6065804.1 hypothetical protein N7444_001457 [Penicillium canescens]
MKLWGELGPAMDEERRKAMRFAGELIIPHPRHLRRAGQPTVGQQGSLAEMASPAENSVRPTDS